ncbi:MAG: S49 family peptidase, partial [Planctomycetota bacterium]
MNKKLFWGSLIILCVCHHLTASTSSTKPASAKEVEPLCQIAVFDIRGPLLEAPAEFEFGFGFDMEPKRTLHSVLKRLNKAKKDKNIKAVVFTFDKPIMGMAQMQEMRQGILALSDAGKDVYCYLEDTCAGIYLLATAASQICMTPIGELDLKGLHGELAYLKGLLDKIGVEADIEHMGAYKGAGEPYTQTQPSEETLEMVNWLLDDFYQQMIETIAKGRKLRPKRVRKLIDRGPFSAQEALNAKLVDKLAYADAFVASLKTKYGPDTEFVRNYAKEKGPELDFSNMFSLFKAFGKMMGKQTKSHRQSIAVVYVDGIILTGKTERGIFGSGGSTGSTTLRRILGKVRQDESIKAVVLRVDSPGGSAVASDIIWNATTELRAQKPLVVSMGNLAASGGYFVSMSGGTIFADPGTITGSIGVVSGKLVTKGLWDWLGVSFYELKRGKN